MLSTSSSTITTSQLFTTQTRLGSEILVDHDSPWSLSTSRRPILRPALMGKWCQRQQSDQLHHCRPAERHVYPPKVPLSLTSTLTTVVSTLRLFSVVSQSSQKGFETVCLRFPNFSARAVPTAFAKHGSSFPVFTATSLRLSTIHEKQFHGLDNFKCPASEACPLALVTKLAERHSPSSPFADQACVEVEITSVATIARPATAMPSPPGT